MQPTPAATGNRLASETSPYLRQHAGNPVDWYPWGPEALELARQSGKPILLSIGYAACHWCHVMAHESFEDAATAALMNRHFVNIKVDREERPDLDRLYQLAQQLLNGRGGGWPLTLFLHHEDQRPFFGGTYFPPVRRHGLPAFGELLERVADYYGQHAGELREPGAALVHALEDLNPPDAHAGELDAAPLRMARAQLEQGFDARFGGQRGAPKFPHAETIARLLRDWHASAGAEAPDLQALYMATLTLTRMAEGGLFDQLGGGFYRYSVDERWEIPHFEKMLYDNATLLGIYAEAAAATGEPLYRTVAGRTADWLLAAMRAPDRGFCSSYDADSEGHEGRYYLWTTDTVRAALAAEDYDLFAAHYGLDGPPNFEGEWHLRVVRPIAGLVDDAAAVAAAERRLDRMRAALLALRAKRVAPGLDDKRLTAWNALAIGGLATAARVLGRADLAAAATAALDFLRREHWRDGRLLATSNGGPARLPAYLDDYAFLAEAILELQTVRFRADELAFACELCEVLLAHFADRERGGFFFTADDHETLIARPKSFADDATPAGNGVAARVLIRLGYLLGETRYLGAAEGVLRAAWPALAKYPPAHGALLVALEEWLHPPEFVILRGPAAIVGRWQEALTRGYTPRRRVLAIPDTATSLPAALAAKTPTPEGVAWYCRGSTCLAPTHSLEALGEQLNGE